MSDIFRRQPADTRHKSVRPLLVGIGFVLVASVAWHTFRPHLVRALARSSIGCSLRSDLISAAVLGLYPQFPLGGAGYGGWLMSYRGPTSAFVMWQTHVEMVVVKAAGRQWKDARHIIADDKLNIIGSVRSWNSPAAALPGDCDHDGKLETTIGYYPLNPDLSLECWGVVRLGATSNEVAGILLVDRQPWHKQNTRLQTQWHDEDADGEHELHVVTVKYGALPGGGVGFLPAETVAVFEWSASAGVLRPRDVPDDGSFIYWVPADGRPHHFSPDTLVEDVFRELLPVPDGFGVPTASQPASQLDTQPALP